jgi:hypothetical protein
MKQLSIGIDSTLENWIKLASIAFGEDSIPVEFLKEKAEKQGLQEEVIADEAQLMQALGKMHTDVRRVKVDG